MNLIDRIRTIEREKKKLGWRPVSITLGWLTHDTLADELGRMYAVYPVSEPQQPAILGIPLIRDARFPIGGAVTFEDDLYLSPYERQQVHLAVRL